MNAKQEFFSSFCNLPASLLAIVLEDVNDHMWSTDHGTIRRHTQVHGTLGAYAILLEIVHRLLCLCGWFVCVVCLQLGVILYLHVYMYLCMYICVYV